MPTVCLSCGENAVDLDQAHTQEQRVCQSCGTVVEEGSLYFEDDNHGNEMNFDGTSNWRAKGDYYAAGAKTMARLPVRGTSTGVRILQRYIYHFSNVLRLSTEVCSQVRDFIFNSVYPRRKEFSRITGCRKTLAAACVYIVVRQNGMKLTLRQMSEMAEVDVYAFGRFFKHLLRSFDIQLEQIEVEDLIPTVLTQFAVEGEKCKNLTFELSELAKDTLIVNGMQSAMACGLVAVAMEAVGKPPTKQKIKEVCLFYGLSNQNMTDRICYIKRRLLTMAEQIPWISKTVSLRMIPRFIPDIIKYHQKCNKLKVSDSRPAWYVMKEKLNKERHDKIERAKARLERQKQESLANEKKVDQGTADSDDVLVIPQSSLQNRETITLSTVISASNQMNQQPGSGADINQLLSASDTQSDTSSVSSSFHTTSSSSSSEFARVYRYITEQGGKGLDADDKLIEYLLQNGVSEEKLMDGYYESHLQSCSSASHSGSDGERIELDEEDIPENFIHQYVRTPSEVVQLKRLNDNNDSETVTTKKTKRN